MFKHDARSKLIKAKILLKWKIYAFLDRLRPAKNLVCPICDYGAKTDTFSVRIAKCIFWGGKLTRHECPNCGVIFGTQRMLSIAGNERALGKELTDLYSVYSEGDTTEYEIQAFHCLNPKADGVYLNYGSGQWSHAIERLREQGFQIYGFEAFVGDRDDKYIIRDINVLRQMRFDGIMSHNLVEHLRNPVETMSFLASLLASDSALMAHSTECFRYAIEFTRFHLFFFTGRSLEVISEKAGLEVRHMANPDIKVFSKKGHMPINMPGAYEAADLPDSTLVPVQ